MRYKLTLAVNMTEHNDVPAFRSETRVGFRQVADGMPFAIVDIDMNFNIVYANIKSIGRVTHGIESGINYSIILKNY